MSVKLTNIDKIAKIIIFGKLLALVIIKVYLFPYERMKTPDNYCFYGLVVKHVTNKFTLMMITGRNSW